MELGNKDLDRPMVSIIVPVYNVEKYLSKCLDSLVNQTLDKIEVIAIDDGSTDSSLSILEEYHEKYPNKVIIKSISHVDGAGAARNAGIEMARADYIAFCDSDDVMDSQAAELLYNRAVEGDYDIVCAPAWHISGSSKVLYGVLKEPISTETLILNGQVYLWGKLIHKRIIQKVGEMPEFRCEDLGYTPALHSYARKIGYIDHPIYFYYKRYGSGSNTIFALRNLDRNKARQYAIENCDSQYLQYVLVFIARSINMDIRKRWIFADKFIEQLKELWPKMKDNAILKSDEYLYNRLENFASLPINPIPRNLFIGGFGDEVSNKWSQNWEKAFYDEFNLIVLNDQNCDVTENQIIKQAYDEGNFEFVNGYFALKAIIKDGGVYIDRRIKIDAPFNYVRYCKAFFSLLDEETYTDWVFGGMSNDPTLKKILETFNIPLGDGNAFSPLKNRIKSVLSEFNMSIGHVNNLFDYPVTVFSPDVMVVDITNNNSLQPDPHICTHVFSENNEMEDYITIKKSTLRALVKVPGANDELNEVKKENAMLRNKIRNLEFPS